MSMNRFEKLFTALKYYLIGRDFVKAQKALQFARSYHTGKRKDKVTAEFQHQLEICMYLTTLKINPLMEEELLMVALLHDIMEDYGISMEEMEQKFGKSVTRRVWLLTKKYKGVITKPLELYFKDIADDEITSLAKGADRIHNLQTMIDVFSDEKQLSYVEEVEKYFLPMIKQAKYNFPEQGAAYFNIQLMLQNQIQLVKKSLNNKKK